MENLSLIDWREVAFGATWIIGLAIVLSTLGFADYRRLQEQDAGFRQVLRRPAYQLPINAGLTLFCLGMIGGAGAWWEIALWALLAVAFAYYAWVAWRGKGIERPDHPVDGSGSAP